MGFVLWLVSTFVAVGFMEAVIKPVAKRWMQRRILAVAPRVLKRLDMMLPSVVLTMDSEGLDAYVRDLFHQVTGDDWTQADLEPFYALFDIRRAADNYHEGE